jgi:hypothetical protein
MSAGGKKRQQILIQFTVGRFSRRQHFILCGRFFSITRLEFPAG